MWGERASDLQRIGADRAISGSTGTILYLHFVNEMTASQIAKHSVANVLYTNTVKTILNGKYNSAAYQLFMEMLEEELEMLCLVKK